MGNILLDLNVVLTCMTGNRLCSAGLHHPGERGVVEQASRSKLVPVIHFTIVQVSANTCPKYASIPTSKAHVVLLANASCDCALVC